MHCLLCIFKSFALLYTWRCKCSPWTGTVMLLYCSRHRDTRTPYPLLTQHASFANTCCKLYRALHFCLPYTEARAKRFKTVFSPSLSLHNRYSQPRNAARKFPKRILDAAFLIKMVRNTPFSPFSTPNKHSRHNPHHKPEVVLLADRLLQLQNGSSITSIFIFGKDLPTSFDPAHPPPGITKDSREAKCLQQFYSRQIQRTCPMIRCNYVMKGFEDTITHQLLHHNRVCTRVCLLDGCLAAFDKPGNATRHFGTQHNNARKKSNTIGRYAVQARYRRPDAIAPPAQRQKLCNSSAKLEPHLLAKTFSQFAHQRKPLSNSPGEQPCKSSEVECAKTLLLLHYFGNCSPDEKTLIDSDKDVTNVLSCLQTVFKRQPAQSLWHFDFSAIESWIEHSTLFMDNDHMSSWYSYEMLQSVL